MRSREDERWRTSQAIIFVVIMTMIWLAAIVIAHRPR